MSARNTAETISDRLTRLTLWALAIAVIAGVTHLTSILMMPGLAPHDAFSRMAALAPLHRTTLLPAIEATPAAAGGHKGLAGLLGLPSSEWVDDPALIRGVCRFDLKQGPLRVRASLTPESLMLMSFHSRYGQIFYSMTDRSATRGRLEVLLFLEQQRDDVEANDSEDELPQELRIVSPTPLGFVLFRSLAERPSDRIAAQRRVAAINCGLNSALTP